MKKIIAYIRSLFVKDASTIITELKKLETRIEAAVEKTGQDILTNLQVRAAIDAKLETLDDEKKAVENLLKKVAQLTK